MTRARQVGTLLILVGVGITLAAIFAHQLGLGPNPGFGWKKLLGTVLGVVLILGGVIVVRIPAVAPDGADEAIAPPID